MATISENILRKLEQYLKEISKEIKIEKVILFGSYAKGSATIDSDIDLAIFSENFKNMDRIEGLTMLLLKTSGLGIDLQPQPFSIDDFNNPEGLVKEIIDTGIELKVA